MPAEREVGSGRLTLVSGNPEFPPEPTDLNRPDLCLKPGHLDAAKDERGLRGGRGDKNIIASPSLIC